MDRTNIKACMVDISRFRVPTISRMKKMIKNLSEVGYDTIFYNIEHVFKIPGHPKIGSEADGYTIEEFKELDIYAKENNIEIIPLIQSFGHMFHILKHPEYDSICESEKKWSLSINDDTYKGYKCWTGYFESFEGVELTGMTLRDDDIAVRYV